MQEYSDELVGRARELRLYDRKSLRTIGIELGVSREWVRKVCDDIPHPDNRNIRKTANKEKIQGYNESASHKRRMKVILALGGVCVRCEFDDWRALQVDHIHGGGQKEYKAIGNQSVYSKIIRGRTEGYQLLCANCNWIKRHEKGEHN